MMTRHGTSSLNIAFIKKNNYSKRVKSYERNFNANRIMVSNFLENKQTKNTFDNLDLRFWVKDSAKSIEHKPSKIETPTDN